ncbi:hypothetical protein [Dyadobacter tibetensis]|uniref:hypothetical protein n=1 Tax=Dyadobacter tibetensis TaxID=1211851 RepID=UPI0004B899A2|nr:hypothetical protein [Dyadobacter tibetensis]
MCCHAEPVEAWSGFPPAIGDRLSAISYRQVAGRVRNPQRGVSLVALGPYVVGRWI